jgi:hypothetical protein
MQIKVLRIAFNCLCITLLVAISRAFDETDITEKDFGMNGQVWRFLGRHTGGAKGSGRSVREWHDGTSLKP